MVPPGGDEDRPYSGGDRRQTVREKWLVSLIIAMGHISDDKQPHKATINLSMGWWPSVFIPEEGDDAGYTRMWSKSAASCVVF